MNTKEIIFALNQQEKIIIPLNEGDTIENIDFISESQVIFIDNNFRYTLAQDTIYESVFALKNKLNSAIVNNLNLSSIFKDDIGFMCNEDMQSDVNTDLNFNRYWLWSLGGKLIHRVNTWLYNRADGTIILEITPSYPWNFEGAELEEDFVPYEEWIKDYKPILIRIIPKEVAQQWFEQADKIVRQIESNPRKNFGGRPEGNYSPKDAQIALDHSVVYNALCDKQYRIGVSQGEIVLLFPTKVRSYHGHVKIWDELSVCMQRALIEANLVDNYGNIL